METTFEPTLQQSFRNRIAVIEAIELSLLSFGFWALLVIVPGNTTNPGFLDLLGYLVLTEVVVLGSWAIYNLYIRIARATGRTLDVILWILASLATGTYTFWAWTILDINRFLLAKIVYRGEAPVEYAWSARSKQVRRAWEQMQKADNA
jgi:hypothetical protein